MSQSRCDLCLAMVRSSEAKARHFILSSLRNRCSFSDSIPLSCAISSRLMISRAIARCSFILSTNLWLQLWRARVVFRNDQSRKLPPHNPNPSQTTGWHRHPAIGSHHHPAHRDPGRRAVPPPEHYSFCLLPCSPQTLRKQPLTMIPFSAAIPVTRYPPPRRKASEGGSAPTSWYVWMRNPAFSVASLGYVMDPHHWVGDSF